MDPLSLIGDLGCPLMELGPSSLLRMFTGYGLLFTYVLCILLRICSFVYLYLNSSSSGPTGARTGGTCVTRRYLGLAQRGVTRPFHS